MGASADQGSGFAAGRDWPGEGGAQPGPGDGRGDPWAGKERDGTLALLAAVVPPAQIRSSLPFWDDRYVPQRSS